jgi:hypothetical protein
VAAVGAVQVAGGVATTHMRGRARRRVRRVDGESAFVDVPLMRTMQMTFVQIIRVAGVGDGCVAAARAVRVLMIGVGKVFVHGRLLARAVRVKR